MAWLKKGDLEKSFEASKIPILYLVVLAILDLFGSILAGLDAFLGLTLLLGLVIFLWAGYNAVNRFKLDQSNSLRTGVITGFIAGWIIMLIRFIIFSLGWVKGASIQGDIAPYIPRYTLSFLLISVVLAFWGGIIAGIGGYMALRGKPKEKPSERKPLEPVTPVFGNLNFMKFLGIILFIYGIYLAVMGLLIQSVSGFDIPGIQMVVFGLGLFVLGLVIIRSESNRKKMKPKQS